MPIIKLFIPIALLALLYTSNTIACSSTFYIKPGEYEGMTLDEIRISLSDIVFHGELIELRIDIQLDETEHRYNIYKFKVLESFKGNIQKSKIIEVKQLKHQCNLPLTVTVDHIVFLDFNEDGKYQFNQFDTLPLDDFIINLDDPNDLELYTMGKDESMALYFKVYSRYSNGDPKVVILTKTGQLKLLRQAASNKGVK